MNEREPSRTAFAAATHRAIHQVVEQGKIFSDPLALSILGMSASDIQHDVESQPSRRGIRLFLAARSRFAESAARDAVEQRGVRQVVVLGAGLDTFSYRHPFPDHIRLFEIDHPATQSWKRKRLEQAGIAIPNSLTYAPIDFEKDSLQDGLTAAGFDTNERTFFMWLGVVPYLTENAIDLTLSVIADLPGGADLVFDYGEPPASLPPELATLHLERAARVAAIGEPFLSYFEPAQLHEKLRALGFSEIEDVLGRSLLTEFAEQKAADSSATANTTQSRSGGGHFLFAATNRQ
ncbi:class I SAM-dependent methyltransferase [Trinickia dinghuensis]|uniref:S-adenosyl-L-methionine-dependent methyltransferase n=1 Tax=Trinickia dinghuensis TaxID=2291023 RepID=A0A3D8JUE6_9BURK|nr:class I SAM-dependent methyltransferase [Trinickia dinghuensis]RDU96266.1 SAM-dependent methyltransferase [Trinickia dinghuensis]